MPTHTVNQIYFGTFDDLDPTEGNTRNENTEVAGWAPGEVFNYDQLKMIEITQNDTVVGRRADRLEENDYMFRRTGAIRGDSYTYDLGDGNGPITSYVDSASVYKVKYTLGNGQVRTGSTAFIQLENGAIFSNPNSLFDNKAIKSIEVVQWVSRNHYGGLVNQSIENGKIACYTAGTLIRTVRGDVPVEELNLGDLVETVDTGLAPILWIGRRKLDRVDLACKSKLRPIRIRAGALGADLPVKDLVVSPQHRVLVKGAIPLRMFGQSEILVAAKELVALDGIEVVEDADEVEYFHLLLARHQLVWANGAPAETLFAGVEALGAMTQDQTSELAGIFPEIAGLSPEDAAARLSPEPARLLAPGRRARQLAERLKKNGAAPISAKAA